MLEPDRRRERDEIRAALSDPLDVCRRLGLDEGHRRQSRGVLIRCPKHTENNASCSVTTADGGGLKVRCFAGCDFGGQHSGGDEISLVAAARGIDIRSDFLAALHAAADLAGVRLEGPAPAAKPRPALRIASSPAAQAVDVSAEWERLPPLDAEAFEYLRDRDLDGAADLCRGVPEGGLSVPGALLGKPDEALPWGRGLRIACALRDAAGRIVGIQARNIGTPHDFRVLGSSQAGLFGEPHLVAGAANVVICEGLTDTLAATVGFRLAKSTAIVGIAGTNNRDGIKTLPLKGKRVFVAMDADSSAKGEIKGDEAAKIIADDVTALGGKPVRLRPVGGKDLADMLAAGVDLHAFARGAIGRALGFSTSAVRLRGERDRRMADAGEGLPIGVGYLQAALGAIVPRDVILIGGESGGGKTELAAIIAMAVAKAVKRVHYFALEPEPDEIERRMKFKRLSFLLHGARAFGADRLNYQDWYMGKCDALTGSYEAGIDREIEREYPLLHTFYRSGSDFTGSDFDRMARALETETDLIILDHVHYFDEEEDQNRAQRRLGRRIRDMAIDTGRPVIIIAHLRKKPPGNRKNPRLIPEKDDFEGSSHLFKPVKRAIIIAPARDQKSALPWMWPTYIALVKNTFDGSRCRYVGLVDFDARANAYVDDYQIGELVKGGEKFEPIAFNQWPQWARP